MSRENVNFTAIAERMKEVRKELGLSQEAFGKPLLLRRQDVHAIEICTRRPGLTVIIRMSEHYDISLNWLIHGIGERYFIK